MSKTGLARCVENNDDNGHYHKKRDIGLILVFFPFLSFSFFFLKKTIFLVTSSQFKKIIIIIHRWKCPTIWRACRALVGRF